MGATRRRKRSKLSLTRKLNGWKTTPKQTVKNSRNKRKKLKTSFNPSLPSSIKEPVVLHPPEMKMKMIPAEMNYSYLNFAYFSFCESGILPSYLKKYKRLLIHKKKKNRPRELCQQYRTE